MEKAKVCQGVGGLVHATLPDIVALENTSEWNPEEEEEKQRVLLPYLMQGARPVVLVFTLDRPLKLNIIDQLSVDRLVLKDDPCDKIQVTSS